MRVKEERVVITFHTTTEAMAAEQEFRQQGLAGRLIPVPRQITSGCGLAWSAPAADAGCFRHFLHCAKLTWDAIGNYWI